jgi:negative regulator of flagellin synthesis FlgM
MRIDLNPGAQLLPESGRTGNQSAASGDTRSSASSDPLGADQAQLSGAHVQVLALVAQALQFPEIRQEKVNSLRQVVLDGSYQPGSKQIAEAVLAHFRVTAAA